MSDDRQNWSLRKEIQKRKQEQAQREAAARRAQQGQPSQPSKPTPPPAATSTSSSSTSGSTSSRGATTPPPTRRSTGTGPLTGLPPATSGPSRRATQRAAQVAGPLPETPSRARRLLLMAGGILGALIVLSLGILMLLPGAGTPMPEPTAELLRVTANDVLAYLRAAGVPITTSQTLGVPNENWNATQGVQFTVVRAPNRGFFLILSYDDDRIGLDSFRARHSERYGEWFIFEFSNILVAASPQTDVSIREEINSHITSFLLAGKRPFVPTTTGTPIQIALEATLTASTPVPTQPRNIVTLPPRTLEGFTPSPMVVARPTQTLRPFTPTPAVTATPSRTRGPLFPTLTPRPTQLRATASPVPTEAINPPPVNPAATPTIDPKDLSTAPTVAPDVAKSRSFNERVPRQIGLFRLDPAQMTENLNGSTLVYITRDGQQFLVVLWITNSAVEAYERYNLDKQAITGGYQDVVMGDEAMITSPGNWVLAMTRYANMVLIIYRPMPGGTVPPREIPNDDTLTLLSALFRALPLD